MSLVNATLASPLGVVPAPGFAAPTLLQVCGNNSSNSDVTTLTVPMIYAPRQGDLIVAFLGWGHTTTSQAVTGLVSPGGFSTLGSSQLGTANMVQCAVQSKTAGASEPTSYVWSWTGGNFCQIHVVVFDSGAVVDGSPVFNNSGATGESGSWQAPAMTATNANEYWLTTITQVTNLVTWLGVIHGAGSGAGIPLFMLPLSGNATDPSSFLGELAGLQLTSAGATPDGALGYWHAITVNGGSIGQVCATSLLVTT